MSLARLSLASSAASSILFRRSLVSRSFSSSSAVTEIKNKWDTPDALYEEARLKPGSGAEKRAFTYFVIGGARFIYASAARLAVINTVATLSPAADVMAMSTVEVDINNLQPGQVITVKWRGKPVFIKRRTEKMVKAEEAVNISELRHAQTDAQRVKNPEFLIVLGVCTHLGCVPLPNAGDYNGWYCPCHGSHYDGSGRIRRGPAPLNLEVPEYKFVGDGKVLLG